MNRIWSFVTVRELPIPGGDSHFLVLYDADSPAHITSISYGLVGTHQGAESFLRFAETLRGPIVRELNTKKPALWTAFPGFDVAFACNLPTTASVTEELDAEKLASVVNQGDGTSEPSG